MKSRIFKVLGFIGLFFWHGFVNSEELRLAVPQFGNGEALLSNMLTKLNDLMMKEHDVRVSFVYLPSKRTLRDMKLGQVDGVIRSRLADVDAVVPDTIMISAPVTQYSISEFYIENIEASADSLLIGIRRGSASYSEFCENANCILAEREDQLLTLLYAGRIQKFYSPTFAIDMNDPKYLENKVQHKIVLQETAHIFLHKRLEKYAATLEKYEY